MLTIKLIGNDFILERQDGFRLIQHHKFNVQLIKDVDILTPKKFYFTVNYSNLPFENHFFSYNEFQKENLSVFVSENDFELYVRQNTGYEALTNSNPTTTNLSLGTITANDLTINNSNGTGVVLPSATPTTAGLLESTDKVKINSITQQVNSDWNATTGLSKILNKPTLLSQFTNDIFIGTNHILVILDGTPIQNSIKLQALIDSGLYEHIMTLGGECDILVLAGIKSIGSLNESNYLIFKLTPTAYNNINFINCKLTEIYSTELFYCSGNVIIDLNTPQNFLDLDNNNFSKFTITNNNLNLNLTNNFNLSNVLKNLKSIDVILPNIFLEIKNSEITFNTNQTNMNAIFINCKMNNPILDILGYIPNARIVNCLDINNVLINQ